MKATGMVRPIDKQGRLVIPAELRKVLNIDVHDAVEMYSTDDGLVVKKYEPACIFCDSAEDTILYNEKYICRKCLAKIQKEANKK